CHLRFCENEQAAPVPFFTLLSFYNLKMHCSELASKDIFAYFVHVKFQVNWLVGLAIYVALSGNEIVEDEY
ncbi:MAG: hypothetical protein ACOYOA_11020, partial [Saprospiraceae bacterium]